MGEKVTMYTLAKELNMSVSVISRAFNPNAKISDEKRQLVLETAQRLGYVQNKMASRLSQDPIHIGVFMRGRIAAYYSKMLEGIQAAYETYRSYKVICDIRVSENEFSVAEVCEILDGFKEAHYEGVILQGIYHEEIIGKVDELTRAGITVATLHNDIPASSRLFTSTTNTNVSAEMAAQLLDIMLPKNRRNVLVFSGSMQNLIHQELVFSFFHYAMNYNLNPVQHYDTLDMPQIAEKLVVEALDTHKDIDGIYISSANSIPICRYIKKCGLSDKITMVTSDVFPALNDYIEQGVVNATIFQDPFSQGYQAFERLYRHIAEGEEIPVKVMTRPQIVLKSNLRLYQK